jgi:hypothetical protein
LFENEWYNLNMRNKKDPSLPDLKDSLFRTRDWKNGDYAARVKLLLAIVKNLKVAPMSPGPANLLSPFDHAAAWTYARDFMYGNPPQEE